MGKSPAEKYADARELSIKLVLEYQDLKDNKPHLIEKATGIKLKERIQKVNSEIIDLEPIKDEKPLSATTKKLIAEAHREIVWNRYENFNSKYTTKGNVQEDETLSIFHKVHPEYIFPERNVARFKNEFLTGMPDIQDGGIILPFDLKSPWDWKTLPYPDEELDEVYEDQNFGYADLLKDQTKSDKWTTFSCLVNTPPALIEQEMQSRRKSMGLAWNAEDTDDSLKACMEIEKNSIYDMERFKKDLHLSGYPYVFRIPEADWVFDVPLDERVIERTSIWTQEKQDEVYARVKELRQYLAKTYPKHWIF